MKLNETPLLPVTPESAYDRALQAPLLDALRATAIKVNLLADEKMVGKDNQRTAVPTTGTWQQGDRITNSTPTEAGTAGSKYVVLGWVCVASGTPGTWVQMRTLTGN